LSGSIFRTVLAMTSGRTGRLTRLFRPSVPGRMAGDKIQRGVLTVAIVLLVAMIVVAVLLGLFSHEGGAGVTSFVLFASAAAVGAGLGFLFGLPRSRVSDLSADGSTEVPAPPAKASTYYLTNSNLIKVSDWLTAGASDLELVLPPNTSDDATVIAQTLPPGTSVPRGTGLTVTMLAPPTAPGGAG
jgi:hypothetical protein